MAVIILAAAVANVVAALTDFTKARFGVCRFQRFRDLVPVLPVRVFELEASIDDGVVADHRAGLGRRRVADGDGRVRLDWSPPDPLSGPKHARR